MKTIELNPADFAKHADGVRALAENVARKTGETIAVRAGEHTCVHADDDEIGGSLLLRSVLDVVESAEQSDIDALAEFAGLNLRLNHDPDAPLPWAVWGSDGIDDEDIIGAGESPTEALESAREQIRAWDAAALKAAP